MRTPGGKLFVEFYKALGADPRIVASTGYTKPSLRGRSTVRESARDRGGEQAL